ncbi:MAG TPA: hypothetical protein VK028_01505 [Micromonosporaceae bacterium]|nr:hypothetical protein [Micromonosporaceae bacterium]
MNEVRDLCERLLDTPAPPMRTADEVLTIARRARRRRNLLTTSGVAGLVLGLVLGIAVVLDRTGGDGPVFVAAPAARASAAHGARMSAVLIGAVPDGHTTGRVETFSDDPVVHPSGSELGDGRAQLLSAAVVRVFAGGGQGQLFAYLVHDGRPAPKADPCAEDAALPRDGRCEVRWVGEVPIRVVTTTGEGRGRVVEATRFLDGGRLVVAAWQGVPVDWLDYPDAERWSRAVAGEAVWSRPPLPAPLLDADRVAAIAADPAMLP